MKVIYGSNFNVVINNGLSPETIIATLTDTYPELANSTYSLTGEGDDQVMTITLVGGGKA